MPAHGRYHTEYMEENFKEVQMSDTLYALNIDDDGRILSATYDQYAPPEQPRVTELPDGNLPDYKYVDGEYVYDPLPQPEPPEPAETTDDVLNVLLGIEQTDGGEADE